MDTNPNLSKPLFHGTSANLKVGEVIRPTVGSGHSGVKTPHAWGTDDPKEAGGYASDDLYRAYGRGGQLPLFATVYTVEPVSKDEELLKDSDLPAWKQDVPVGEWGKHRINNVGDPQGMRVTGVAYHKFKDKEPWG